MGTYTLAPKSKMNLKWENKDESVKFSLRSTQRVDHDVSFGKDGDVNVVFANNNDFQADIWCDVVGGDVVSTLPIRIVSANSDLSEIQRYERQILVLRVVPPIEAVGKVVEVPKDGEIGSLVADLDEPKEEVITKPVPKEKVKKAVQRGPGGKFLKKIEG